MTQDPDNRMATPIRRGRPRKEDLASRPAPTPTQEVPLVVRRGIVCPACGRGMTMREVNRTVHPQGTVICGTCGLCGARLKRRICDRFDRIQVIR